MKFTSFKIYIYNYLGILFFSLLLWPPEIKAEVPPIKLEVLHPAGSELLKKKIEDTKTYVTADYRYKGKLSQEELQEFYREIFLSEGLKENSSSWDEYNKGNVKTFIFERGVITAITLGMFTSSVNQDETIYSVHIFETKDLLFLATLKFELPKALKFMPTYLNAKQFAYTPLNDTMGVSYLVPGDVKDLIEFYLKEMPKRGWNLTGRKDREGRYNLFVALTMGLPGVPLLKEKLNKTPEDLAPGVDVEVEGSTLSFDRGQERCVMVINKFLDPPELLKAMRIDPAAFEKHGRILFSVEYYAK